MGRRIKGMGGKKMFMISLNMSLLGRSVAVDGERWRELSTHRTKRVANAKAKKVREQGVKARVKKFSFGYVVAVEPKSLTKFIKKRR